jgi:hypothetical protein
MDNRDAVTGQQVEGGFDGKLIRRHPVVKTTEPKMVEGVDLEELQPYQHPCTCALCRNEHTDSPMPHMAQQTPTEQ